MALQVSTEIGVGQLVQICIKRSGCIAIEEGFGGQNGANDIVKRFVNAGIGQNYAIKRAFDASNCPNERLEKYKSELTVQGGLLQDRKRAGSELPAL